MDEHQRWVRDDQLLKDMTLEFFFKLYKSEGNRDYGPILQKCECVVTYAMNQQLISIVTQEEVRLTIFQLGKSRALGPDGFNGLFYQHYWEILKQDVFSSVKQFFQSGLMPPDLNKTIITLIPKVPNPECLDQYRPISLCNYTYKIISKVLANRLKPFLPNIISMEQSAFVSGRQIQDNILIVQEILHQLKTRTRKKKFQAVVKMDMTKAYDRVEWDFLKNYLSRLGFHPIWVQWTMQCITTVSISVKFNGTQLQYFQPTRGIRQGDPLSPYLFILMANMLSTLIHQALLMGNLKGIQLNRWCLTLTHLFFADDAIFFLEGSSQECQELANILNQYCLAMGQAIKSNKSGIFCSKGCPSQLQDNLAQELRIPVLAKTGKYLGIPLDWGRSK